MIFFVALAQLFENFHEGKIAIDQLNMLNVQRNKVLNIFYRFLPVLGSDGT